MKKILSAILALLLLLGLCACGGESETNTLGFNGGDQSQITPGQGSNSAQGKTITVHVTINPEFTLTLDGNLNILDLEAENEDAETLLSGLELTGKSYDEGMGLVLNAAYDQGYLTEAGQVSIQVAAEDYSTDLMETLFAPVAQFKEEKAVSVSAENHLLLEKITGDRPDDLAGIPDSKLNGLVPVEVNGQKIYVERNVDNISGTTRYYYYNNSSLLGGNTFKIVDIALDGSFVEISYCEYSMVYKSVVARSDGSYEIYEYENGDCNKVRMISADGSFYDTYTTYHENGYPATVHTVYSNGDICEETYTENGNCLSRIWHWADGGYEEGHFTESGLNVKTKCYYANGDYYIQIYYDNGNIKQYEFQMDGYSGQILYYENGNCMSEVTTNPDGSISRFFYNEDGILISQEHEEAGS